MNFIDPYDYDNVKFASPINQVDLSNFYKKIDFYHKRIDALVAFSTFSNDINIDKNIIELKVVEEIKKIDFKEITQKLFEDREKILKENLDLKKRLDLIETQGLRLVSLLEEVVGENEHNKLPDNIKEDGDSYYKFKNQQWVKLEEGEGYLVHSKLFTKTRSDLWTKNPYDKKLKLEEEEDEIPF